MSISPIRESDQVALQESALERLSRLVVRLIQIVAVGLALSFGYLEWQNTPIDRLVRVFGPDSPTKFGLFLFFTAWIYGATQDTEIQKHGYRLDPGEGSLGLREIGGVFGFLFFFSIIFLFHEQLVIFQILLTIFILVDVVSRRLVLIRAGPIIERTFEYYSKLPDNRCVAKLAIVVDYMNGRWQKRRYIALMILCLLQIALAVLVRSGVLAQSVSGMTFNGAAGDLLVAYIPGVMFVGFVLISETWMNVYRLRAVSDMKTIDYLHHYFSLNRHRGAGLPSVAVKPLFDMSTSLNENYR